MSALVMAEDLGVVSGKCATDHAEITGWHS
jgi:hypothetical protein